MGQCHSGAINEASSWTLLIALLLHLLVRPTDKDLVPTAIWWNYSMAGWHFHPSVPLLRLYACDLPNCSLLMLVGKCIIGKAPHLSRTLPFTTDAHGRHAKASMTNAQYIGLPPATNSSHKAKLSYEGAALENSLPNTVWNSRNFLKFKAKCKSMS